MGQYFAKDYTGGAFVLFGPAHLAFLALVLAGILALRLLRRKSERFKRNFRIAYTVIMVLNELSWHAWKAWIGEWTVQEMLPLHLCSIFVILNSIMLLTRNYRIYEIAYFLGTAGAMQALLTPDAGIYGLPHFRAFQTLIAHGMIMSAPIYMTTVEGYRPYWRSIPRVFLYANLYMIAVTGLNLLIGSNYMYTLHKPATASLMDMLGPWPFYLLPLEIIGLVICVILYLPYVIQDWRANRTPAAA
ncbi:MAG TPA: TIGR02206 family membrane protein [Anaerolineaceae bacterium]